jgi:2-polyprenyl-3-methyl-5-hydroxy-6-metoxy-1,4-benzoquinol methylase
LKKFDNLKISDLDSLKEINAIMSAVNKIFPASDERLVFEIWDYLDVGCKYMDITTTVASRLDTFAFGLDFVERYRNRDYDDTNISYDLSEDYRITYNYTFMLITFNDILHHVPNPEILVEDAIARIKPGGSIIIGDHDCTSWKDVYYLDMLHYGITKTAKFNASDYLTVYGYRSAKYWINFIMARGMRHCYIHRHSYPYKWTVMGFKKS